MQIEVPSELQIPYEAMLTQMRLAWDHGILWSTDASVDSVTGGLAVNDRYLIRQSHRINITAPPLLTPALLAEAIWVLRHELRHAEQFELHGESLYVIGGAIKHARGYAVEDDHWRDIYLLDPIEHDADFIADQFLTSHDPVLRKAYPREQRVRRSNVDFPHLVRESATYYGSILQGFACDDDAHAVCECEPIQAILDSYPAIGKWHSDIRSTAPSHVWFGILEKRQRDTAFARVLEDGLGDFRAKGLI